MSYIELGYQSLYAYQIWKQYTLYIDSDEFWVVFVRRRASINMNDLDHTYSFAKKYILYIVYLVLHFRRASILIDYFTIYDEYMGFCV